MIKNNIFDTVAGLPVHPLIDHLVVVALPTFSLLTIALVFVPKLRKNYGLLTLAGLAVSTVAAFIAKESGEALSMRVGYPTDHANMGENLVLVSAILFGATAVWFFLLSNPKMISEVIVKLVGYVTSLIALAALVMTVLVGHSGAKATWEPRLNPVAAASAPAEAAPTDPALTSNALTMDAVAQKNTVDNCWVVVNGMVYDLTGYANSHPGGAKNITNLCGKDATQAFSNQHGAQSRPNNTLAGFEIGTLSSTSSASALPIAPVGNGEREEGEESENE